MESSELRYAGVGVRLLASLVDWIILFIPCALLGVSTGGIGSIVFYLAYKSVFECSKAQATPGKRAMGIQVTNMKGERLDFKASLIRTIVSLLSGTVLFVGHLAALFTEKKQTAHDLLAESVVIVGENGAPLIDSWMETARDIFGSKSSNVQS